jgi:hypothetical protein
MHEAGEIARPYRGKYTAFNHPSLLRKSMSNAPEPADISDTTDTLDTSDTSDTFTPLLTSVG